MIREETTQQRQTLTKNLTTELVIIGGGMAGVCAAITAARMGAKVILVQNRPVLGGNASSEVRLWILGATSHMFNNNRWAREGGVINEIMVENLYRNPEGNALILDTIVLEKVKNESNITLLLNTVCYEIEKSDSNTISAAYAYCSQNETTYYLQAPLFCDASGDGILGFLSGAAFRMGAEAYEEFHEKFAPDESYGELLGHTIYFHTKKTGKPVRYVAPSYALKEITQIPRYKEFNADDYGCRLWWIEYGGRGDTVHETEDIKWELWKVVYGVWDYIKNSGQFPEAEDMTLEWVGTIPGKRESRRFEGPTMLVQQDIVEQKTFTDAVSMGGWSIDLHPADGVYSKLPGCNQWHAHGVYQIPYSTMISKNITNLFLAGRIISASHVAFASTRVMATCAHSAQAVGVAAALCTRNSILPQSLLSSEYIQRLQTELLRRGQYIPGVVLYDSQDLVQSAKVVSSSQLLLKNFSDNGEVLTLSESFAQLLPLPQGPVPAIHFWVDCEAETTLVLEFRTCSRPGNFTPDQTLSRSEVKVEPGKNQKITASFEVNLDQEQYGFFCLFQNEAIQLHLSDQRTTGVLSLQHEKDQAPEKDIGIHSFEFWCPSRRPQGKNAAFVVAPPVEAFPAEMIRSGIVRPVLQSNAWVADWQDSEPTLTLQWDTYQTIQTIDITFDTDWDHPMESTLMGHPEDTIPFCVQRFQIKAHQGKTLWEENANHLPLYQVVLPQPVETNQLTFCFLGMNGDAPASVFEIRCYSSTY